MTPEQMNIKLAEWAGWKWHGSINGRLLMWPPDHGDAQAPPDYCNNLNAVRELEERLNQDAFAYYMAELDRVTAATSNEWLAARMCKASAPQRCEALLKTLGLWEEEA